MIKTEVYFGLYTLGILTKICDILSADFCKIRPPSLVE
jgi:hypothetical protein